MTTYRADDESVSAYPISLRDSLPAIPIPLRDTDENVSLNLQAVFDRVYADGPSGSVDYSKRPAPQLNAETEKWAKELLKTS